MSLYCYMWLVLLFYFLYACETNVVFHVVAGVALMVFGPDVKRYRIASTIGLFFMFSGFYLNRHIMDFAFLPWWVICIMGLRHREVVVVVFGIILGIYLYNKSVLEVIGHVLMNIGAMFHTSQVSMREHGVVHIFLGSLVFFYQSDAFGLNECLAIVGAMLVCAFDTPLDWFSLSMVFSKAYALPLGLLHAGTLQWLEYYRNNHYLPVHHNFLWLVPVSILVFYFFTYSKTEPILNI